MTFSPDEKRIIRSAYELQSGASLPTDLKESLEASINNQSQSPVASSDETADESADESIGLKQRPKRYLVGLAACVLLSAVVGLIVFNSNQVTQSLESRLVSSGSAIVPAGGIHDAWVQRVVDYQSLYTANTVTSKASMSEGEAIALIESMGIKKGTIDTLPSFDNAGYHFARAQQLGFNGQPLVQLVYTKPGEIPLAFCFMPVVRESSRELTLSRAHGLGVASWVGDEYHFVLVADEGDEVLMGLYRAVVSIVKTS